MSTEREPLTARIPTDIEMPDKILFGFTARQAAILAVTGLVGTWVYVLAGRALPTPVLVAVLVPIIALGFALAAGRRDGISLDKFAAHAAAFLRRPKTFVPEGVQVHRAPVWCRQKGPLPAPFRHPVRALRADGVMELADGGTAVIVRTSTVPFGLRTPAEQTSLVSMFGGWLNSLDGPVQILVRAHPVDLASIAEQITQTAHRLADPALEEAARAHAEFLADLNSTQDLLTREALLVLRHEAQPVVNGVIPGVRRKPRRSVRRETSAAIVLRRADDAARSLSALGLVAEVLDAPEVQDLMTRALCPGHVEPVGTAHPEDVITLHEETA
ncbi:PrgI family protein [Actinocorallia sp. API 0066]|uniref:PrgI family protein n=1 Tax=Actinocorallia sp. API 0066 TaxID=2896846 RepID=UPI001E5D6F8B|nr:PrgI family protein [Actinocorallia sp. API 0066]MCD0450413.1 PrgI family protein [Actinocorallia sp. API 0066]